MFHVNAMEEDDYPNFGNAYPPTASADPGAVAASWNPALRPHEDAKEAVSTSIESDDDFFERYPGATPKKAQAGNVPVIGAGSPLKAKEDVVDEADPEAQIRRNSISVQYMVDVSHDDATPEMLQESCQIRSMGSSSP